MPELSTWTHIYHYSHRTTQLLAASLGITGASWILFKYQTRTLPFLRTYAGFNVTAMACYDIINALLYLYDGILSFYAYENCDDLCIDDRIQFVVYQVWDLIQLGCALLAFTFVFTIIYILSFNGQVRLLLKFKWPILLFNIFSPLVWYFMVFSLVCNVPIYMAGRNLSVLSSFKNANAVCLKDLPPADYVYFGMLLGATILNLIVSLGGYLVLTGRNSWSGFFRFRSSSLNGGDPQPMARGNQISLRLLTAFAISTLVTWLPYSVLNIYTRTGDQSSPVPYQIMEIIHGSISPARGFFLAMAIIWTFKLKRRRKVTNNSPDASNTALTASHRPPAFYSNPPSHSIVKYPQEQAATVLSYITSQLASINQLGDGFDTDEDDYRSGQPLRDMPSLQSFHWSVCSYYGDGSFVVVDDDSDSVNSSTV